MPAADFPSVLMDSHPSVSFVFASDGFGRFEESLGPPPTPTFATEIDVLMSSATTFGQRLFGRTNAFVLDLDGAVVIAGSRGHGRGTVGVVATDRSGLGLLMHKVRKICDAEQADPSAPHGAHDG